MKICSLYGAGFYYIPGTDTCLKVGGFVRAEMDFYANGSFGAYSTVNFDDPATNVENTRVRFGLTADARSQTAYGTLRAFVYMAPTATDADGGGYYSVYAPVGFIQWAGFTFGLTASFFDFDTQGYTNGSAWVGSSFAGAGMPVFAYTAQFGNGLSATLSVEDTGGRSKGVTGAVASKTSTTNVAAGFTSFYSTQTYAGREWPDLVGNLRIDQAWGSAQIMGAVHNIHSQNAGSTVSDYEQHATGYALGGGLKFNLPMLGKGDAVEGQVSYAKGAMDYLVHNLGAGSVSTASGGRTPSMLLSNGSPATTTAAIGDIYDAVQTGGVTGSLDLTTGWSIWGGYEHHWDPMWKTSLYGGYASINYSSAASAVIRPAGTTGDADFSTWQIGSRTVWTPVENLDLSVDVVYSELNTAYNGQTSTAGVSYEDKGFLAGIFRVQRNF